MSSANIVPTALVAHGVAAIFDDDGLAGIAPEIGQRRRERRGLRRRDRSIGLGHGARNLARGRRRRQRSERRAQLGDADASRALVEMKLRMRGGMLRQLRRHRLEPCGELAGGDLVDLGQHDLVGHRGLVEQLHERRGRPP